MDNKGNILFKASSDTLKNGIVFSVLGIVMIILSNFVYAKFLLLIFGLLFLLFGLYLLIFKKKGNVIIYDNVIVLNINGKRIINKKEIKSIVYKELKINKGITSYYPILLLDDGSEVFINIAFNRLLNTNLEKVIKSYLD